jgi:hypothetical protein
MQATVFVATFAANREAARQRRAMAMELAGVARIVRDAESAFRFAVEMMRADVAAGVGALWLNDRSLTEIRAVEAAIAVKLGGGSQMQVASISTLTRAAETASYWRGRLMQGGIAGVTNQSRFIGEAQRAADALRSIAAEAFAASDAALRR